MSRHENTIWTIGHSTHSETEFLEMLQSFEIGALADVRSYPGSKRYPHFNKDHLAHFLPKHHIGYHHLRDLGGRRKTSKDSENTAWRLPAFRGYADYMQTPEFKVAIGELEAIALKKRTAYMCAEAVWWSCHRSLISDYLKSTGWTVMHIMGIGKAEEHPYTSAATIENGKLRYDRPKKGDQGKLEL